MTSKKAGTHTREMEDILHEYGIDQYKAFQIKTGLINQTYDIDSERGHFILQKLHPMYGVETINDTYAVTTYVNAINQMLPEIICAQSGQPFVPAKEGAWRLSHFIDGNVYEAIFDDGKAYEAGRRLGEFHQITKSLEYHFMSKVPIPHQSTSIFKRFIEVVSVQEEDDPEIINLIEEVQAMPQFFLPTSLTRTVTHGDPKISNIIFSNNRGCVLVDLDGCNQNSVLLEIGDALRSWCSGFEDQLDNAFNLSRYEAALKGYVESTDVLPKNELNLIPQAVKLISLELASKFLRDYYLDRYFAWDSQKYLSRKHHNLARARSQINLFHSLQEVFSSP